MIDFRGSDNSKNSSILGLDLTPLIDIIFIVLVFLLLTANTQLLSLPVELPTQTSTTLTAITQDKNLTINVLETQPHWALDGVTFNDFDKFESAFIQQYSSQTSAKVIIAADKSAQVQPLMTLLALLQEQEISNTQILMEP